ncbi:MAG: TIGR03663 family protein [Planctomycetota bacterium]|nr:TIGR03663 family protein [Planctomycetota bacterium]
MKRPLVVFAMCLLAAAASAAALRLPRLDLRPMHGDEANQAVKAGLLLETGVYRYDPHEHHGPTLYFLTLPSLALAKAKTFAETTEFDFRIVPVVFGIGLVLLAGLVADGIGRPAAVGAAALTALSPAMVFYSRYYIQEMLLVFFTFGVMASAWRYVRTRRVAWLLAAGAFVGLMAATKETWVFAAAAMAAALVAVILWRRRADRQAAPLRPYLGGWRLVDAFLVAALVAVVLFSSFFTNARGPLDAVLTYAGYADKAGGAGLHDNPWHFYLGLLANSRLETGATSGPWWSEGLILGLALLGMAAAFVRRGIAAEHVPLARFLALYTIILTVLYALIPYKTPWCALGFLHGMILMAGVGAVALVRWAPTWPLKGIGCVLLAALAAHLGWQAYRASFKFPADQRNPYVYAHTVPDVLNLAKCVEDVAAVSPQGREMIVKVITAENYWPLPWYLRHFNPDHVGYYHEVPDNPEAGVIIVGTELQAEVDTRLGRKHGERLDQVYNRQCLFGLRPQVFMRVYVAADLWDALMKERAKGEAR